MFCTYSMLMYLGRIKKYTTELKNFITPHLLLIDIKCVIN